jgi:hypothetical protein
MSLNYKVTNIVTAIATLFATAEFAHAAGIDDSTVCVSFLIWIVGSIMAAIVGVLIGKWFGIRGVAFLSSAVLLLSLGFVFARYGLVEVSENILPVVLVEILILAPFAVSGLWIIWASSWRQTTSRVKAANDEVHQ